MTLTKQPSGSAKAQSVNLVTTDGDKQFNSLTKLSELATDTELATKEDGLGNPSTNGDYLSSTTGGTRSWVTDPNPNPLTLDTEKPTTSGTSIDFTSIPSWVQMITLQFVGVSTNGTSSTLIQLGTSSSPETSGYLGASTTLSASAASTNYTAGFGVRRGSADNILHGSLVFTLEDSANDTWVCFGVTCVSETAATITTAGSKSLAGTLDMLRLTTVNGTDTFDAGAVNILYQ